ncbi:MAG: hypothetical protein ACM3WV_01935 [Bacillota bacterium]
MRFFDICRREFVPFFLAAMSVAFILTAAAIPGVRASGGLVMEKIEPVKSFGEPPYVTVDLKYPEAWGDGTLQFFVNREKAVHMATGGGSGGGFRSVSCVLYVGEPGKKKIEAVFASAVKRSRAIKSFNFRSDGDILLVNHAAGAAMFEIKPLSFRTYFVTNMKVFLNGTAIMFESKYDHIMKGCASLNVIPALRQGNNMLEITGRRPDGRECRKKFPLFYIRDGRVKAGETFRLGYGYEGSRSGPFFKLEIAGESLVPDGDSVVERCPVLLENNWIGMNSIFFQSLKAEKAGNAIIKILRKNHFRDKEYAVDKKMELVVEP